MLLLSKVTLILMFLNVPNCNVTKSNNKAGKKLTWIISCYTGSAKKLKITLINSLFSIHAMFLKIHHPELCVTSIHKHFYLFKNL
jgi:hypothetical protein